MEVPCPICDFPISGDSEDDILGQARQHAEDAHNQKDVQQITNHVRGIIRNLPTPEPR